MKIKIKVILILYLLLFTLFVPLVWAGTTGKIAGIVSDKSSGDPLAGANVIVKNTRLGAAADINGQFTILHLPPGMYELEVSVIGYTKIVLKDVRVRIDQTTRVNFELESEALDLDQITIVAERDNLKKDVATSVLALTSEEVEVLPVSSIESVVELQAGIQWGLSIRGGGADETLFLMDGATLRDPRNNRPITGLSLSAIKELSVERGGFNAEYGQVRAGIVNVVTKEGSKSAYHGSLELKYSPPAAKHFGISPFDKNSFWLRPYYDDEVCWTGTKGEPFEDLNSNLMWDKSEPFTDVNNDGRWTGWDKYTQKQYPDFEGWYAVSERLMSDNNPDNDLSPLGAQRVFMWETRKQPVLDQPDYNIDTGFGGPVPLIGKQLGDLRFFTSYRRNREMLLFPLTREDYVDYDWSLKVTSDIRPSMKLMLSALTGKQFTIADNWSDWLNYGSTYLRFPSEIVGVSETGLIWLFGTGHFSLTDINHQNLAAKFTHVLNVNTFYEVSIEHTRRHYFTRPTAGRDRSKIYEVFPGYFEDAAPFGYNPASESGITGMTFGEFTSRKRDNSTVSATTMKVDLISQVNFSNLVKAGAEFVYNDLDLDYGNIGKATSDRYDERVQLNTNPLRAALYLQDKLETKGFIMNAGLRLDYSHSNTDWWDVDPFDKYFFSSKFNEQREFPTLKSKSQWQLSPRLGISHPITENSKLFFNYGHFKQMPSYETLFRIGRSYNRNMESFGDPNLILAKTISYELGYDHALFQDYLIQLAAFYRDIFDQQNITTYNSIGGIVYDKTTSNSYEDIRGFELTLRKSGGRWWTFFANYTYQVSTSGHFGREKVFQDPALQKEYDENTKNLYQERPIPRPYARLNLSVYTPEKYGPEFNGLYPLGGFMANLLLNWQERWATWNPTNLVGIRDNVKQADYFNAILRLGKTFHVHKFRIYAFVDIDNLFNYRLMSLNNFGGKAGDWHDYMSSLHLPESEVYDNIPGDDQVGTYRADDVRYQPMLSRGKMDFAQDTGETGVIYYDRASKRFVEYVDNTWMDVEKTRLDRILEDKAYIDMPNQDSFTFLDPRQIYFGLRISFDLN